LVVEDDPLNMKLVRTLLELENYEVIEVESGEQALRVAVQQRPDLILMDVQLPGIDGLQTCMQLKSDPITAAIPVIALTSYAMPGDERRAFEAGCAGYITKPIDADAFPGLIAEFMGRR
jgi:CheY-like chemotaxis protein